MNVAAHLIRAAGAQGEAPALALGSAVLASYRDVAAASARLAGAFVALGLKPGDRIGLAMRNTPDYVTLLYAAWHAGLAVAPLNSRLHPDEFAFALADCGARVCFVTEDLSGAVGGAVGRAPALERLIVIGGPEHRRLMQADALGMISRAADDPAWLFYTSGTTGKPKGATLTHRNLIAMALAYTADVDVISPGDSILHAAPMSHGSGLYIVPHVMCGALHVVPESGGLDPAETMDLLDRGRGVAMFAAPTMVKRLLRRALDHGGDARSLKTVIYGGGPMYTADIKASLERFGARFAQIYGQGESPMTITVLSKHHHADTAHPRYEERLASVGVAQAPVEVRIADADDRALPAGETGEILVRGDTVMRGYWNNETASAATLRNGWLHTGDVGALDADGFLTLKDRTKDLIISGGSNIYPREVEDVLLQCPGVAEAAVIGRPHAEWGEEVVAFVVAASPDVTAEALDAQCLNRIARFKRPRVYRFIEALPKNNYGKVLKTELRARETELSRGENGR